MSVGFRRSFPTEQCGSRVMRLMVLRHWILRAVSLITQIIIIIRAPESTAGSNLIYRYRKVDYDSSWAFPFID